MKKEELNQFSETFLAECKQVQFDKQHDYTGGKDTDCFQNFKGIAERLGVSPILVWFIYFTKHTDSVTTFVRTGVAKSETLRGRFMDIVNYAILGAALVEELNEQNTSAA